MEKTISKPIKDPLMHIARKDTMTTGRLIASKFLAILGAFIVSSIILGISEGCDPFTFLISIFRGTFSYGLSFWSVLRDTAILLGLGLALLPAYKMKYWNTGADGQALVAALAAYMVLYNGRETMGDFALLALSFLAAITAGIIWAIIPAIFKAFWNTNETLFTLMMNYVAIQLVAMFINGNATGGSNTLPNIYQGSLGMIYQYLTLILIVVFIFVFVTLYLKHTKHGYELSLVGESVNTAKYAGINVKKVIIRTLVLSGIICGIIGFVMTNGLNHVVNTTTLGGRGFTAIIIVWLSNFNPGFMVLASFGYVFLEMGCKEVLIEIGATNSAITSIIISIFIFFIIGCTFFSRYKLLFRRNSEGKIDNKFLAFMDKIITPIVNAFTKVYVPVEGFIIKCGSSIKNFVTKPFKKKNINTINEEKTKNNETISNVETIDSSNLNEEPMEIEEKEIIEKTEEKEEK